MRASRLQRLMSSRAALAVAAAVLLASCGTAEPRAFVDCTTFPNQRAAQAAANTTDGDGDGVYCERLPCPCARPSGRASVPAARRPQAAPGAAPVVLSRVRIDEVIDGDTLDVQLPSGSRQRVRLVGIDAPESSTLRTGHAECGGQAAASAARALARRFPLVTLRSDPTEDTYDRYGRLLAYAEPNDERATTFQEALLEQGWAKVYVFDTPFARVAAFRRAAAAAKSAGAGVWRACGGQFRKPL